MTRYASGRRKEWDVVRRLRAAGWSASRSAGSHGLWDVVAAKRGQRVRLIQVKYTAKEPVLDDRTPPSFVLDSNAYALLALEGRDETPVDAELWVYYRGVTAPVVYNVQNGAWVRALYRRPFEEL